MNEKSTAQGAGAAPKWRGPLLWALILLILAVGLYAVGFLNGRSQVVHLRSQLDTAQESLAKVKEQRDVALARALLYQAATDLEERNFGKAQQRISQAATGLAALPPGGGEGGDAIRAVQKLVGETRIDVTANVEAQRSAVLGLAKRLDSLQPQ